MKRKVNIFRIDVPFASFLGACGSHLAALWDRKAGKTDPETMSNFTSIFDGFWGPRGIPKSWVGGRGGMNGGRGATPL